MKFYGSISNRLEENKIFCEEIKEGTQATEFFYSDRKPFEVVKVLGNNHFLMRELDHEAAGEPMSNCWNLKSNPANKERELKKWRGAWCWVNYYTRESIKNAVILDRKIIDKVNKDGRAASYTKTAMSFGFAEYYYDYGF